MTDVILSPQLREVNATSQLVFITAHSASNSALCDHLPANIQPITARGLTCRLYAVLLPDDHQIDLNQTHKPYLDAGHDNGKLWQGGGVDSLLRMILPNVDLDKIASHAPKLTESQYNGLMQLFGEKAG